MGAVKTPTRNQMRGNCGKARNHHTLQWLMEPVKAYKWQNVQILSFHPISRGVVANATWRLRVVSRTLSTCFLIGAPLKHGRMRLIEPRGFRALWCWVWLFHFVALLFLHSFMRYVFHCVCVVKELDLNCDWHVKIVRKVKFYVMIH